MAKTRFLTLSSLPHSLKRNNSIEQASHNERLAEQFLFPAGESVDWGITLTFYDALHLVNAFRVHITNQPIPHPWLHRALNVWVAQNLPVDIVAFYIDLYTYSREARYDNEFGFYLRTDQRNWARDLLTHHLTQIKNFLRGQGLNIPPRP
ncbi:hypothetical protein HYR99_24685 [Candidatus Poribacteria bacterium]|nr:hypothetical protein [Candidatus Poribacteria bacterium]